MYLVYCYISIVHAYSIYIRTVHAVHVLVQYLYDIVQVGYHLFGFCHFTQHIVPVQSAFVTGSFPVLV